MSDTRPDHTEALARIIALTFRNEGEEPWHYSARIATGLLDPSNRAVLIAALTDHGTDDILDALVNAGVLRVGDFTTHRGRVQHRLVSAWREVGDE